MASELLLIWPPFMPKGHRPPSKHQQNSPISTVPDATKAQAAGDYILALFEQSWADETDGRTAWQSLPFWGGGSNNPARTYRGQLADAFARAVPLPRLCPAALWLIEHDLVEDNIASGAQALSRIHGLPPMLPSGPCCKSSIPRNRCLPLRCKKLPPRHLVQDKASVIALEQSYRSAVRNAADAAAIQLVVPHEAVWQEGQVYSLPDRRWLLKDSSSSVTLLTGSHGKTASIRPPSISSRKPPGRCQ